MSKTKIIAFANNKGGSGKTTSCANIGCALSMMDTDDNR
jgi:chromosome partitioning protein